MKNGCSLLVVFSLIWFACFAEEKIPTLQDNKDKVEKLLNRFDLDLSLFLCRREKNLAASEVFLKEEGVWAESVKESKELQSLILKQKAIFITFRDSLAEVISLSYGKNPMGDYEVSMAELDMTEWYVKFLKRELMWRQD